MAYRHFRCKTTFLVQKSSWSATYKIIKIFRRKIQMFFTTYVSFSEVGGSTLVEWPIWMDVTTLIAVQEICVRMEYSGQRGKTTPIPRRKPWWKFDRLTLNINKRVTIFVNVSIRTRIIPKISCDKTSAKTQCHQRTNNWRQTNCLSYNPSHNWPFTPETVRVWRARARFARFRESCPTEGRAV